MDNCEKGKLLVVYGVNIKLTKIIEFGDPHMYDPQINMISKPFKLNKERLKKYFMSSKYENRRKEFFATFSEFLQTHIRKIYYDFMNDIQTEVNFFKWFDKYYKSKILNDRTTKNLLQNEDKATHKIIITKDRPLSTNTKHIIPNTRPMTTNNKPTNGC